MLWVAVQIYPFLIAGKDIKMLENAIKVEFSSYNHNTLVNILSCFLIYCSFKALKYTISISSFQESVANFSLSHL